MNVKGAVRDGARAFVNTLLKSSSSWVEQASSWFLRGMTAPPGTLLKEPYKQHGTVYKAVTSVARNAATVPIEFFKGNSDVAVEDPRDPVVSLFRNPFPNVRGSQFIEHAVMSMELTGDWYVYLDGLASWSAVNREQKFPTRLRRLYSWGMWPSIDNSLDEVTEWKYSSGGWSHNFKPDEIMHAYYTNPYMSHCGISPLQAAMAEVESDYQALLWNLAYFKNSARPDIVFTREREAATTPKLDRSFEEAWKLSHGGGVHQSQGVAMLPPGVGVEQLGANHRQMEFEILRRFSREQILSIFDVPPAVAGVFEFANYSNSRVQLQYFWYHKIFPLLRYLESVIQVDILDRYNTGYTIKFKTEEIQALIDDFEQKVITAKRLWDMGYPSRDVNDRMNLGFEPKEKHQEVGWLPVGVAPADKLLERDITMGGGGEPVKEDNDKDRKALKRFRQRLPQFGRRSPAAFCRFLDMFRSDIERTYAGRVKALYTKLEREVIGNVQENLGKSMPTTKTDVFIFDLEEAYGELVKISKPAFKRALDRAGKSVLAETDIDFTFDVMDPAVKLLMAKKEVKLRKPLETLREEVRETIQHGMNEAMSVAEITQLLQDTFGIARGRAENIARTELGSVFNGGRVLAMKQAGIEYHQWSNSGDDKVRDSHQNGSGVGGEIVKIGDQFSNGLEYPGDPNGPIEEVAECRCGTTAVIERAEEDEAA